MQDQPLHIVRTPDMTGAAFGCVQTKVVKDLGLASISYWLEQPFDTAIDALRQIQRQRRGVANESLGPPSTGNR